VLNNILLVVLVISVLTVTSFAGMVTGRITARRQKAKATDIDVSTVMNAFFSGLAAFTIMMAAIKFEFVNAAVIAVAVATSLIAPLLFLLAKASYKLAVRVCSVIDRLDSQQR